MSRAGPFVCTDPFCVMYGRSDCERHPQRATTVCQKYDAIVRLARELEPQSPAGVLLGITIDLLGKEGVTLEQALAMVRTLYADGERVSLTRHEGLEQLVS